MLSIKLTHPQFEGQTKTKLGNTEVTGIVGSIVGEELADYLEGHPAEAKKILDKCVQSAHAQGGRAQGPGSRAAQERPGWQRVAREAGRLLARRIRHVSELYIVEGDSAGGSAKQGRDRRFQAILPIKGKILNVEKARLDKALSNDEIRAIITAIGTGFGEEEFDHREAPLSQDHHHDRRGRGRSHIRTLLLTFFYRYMKPLVEGEFIYIAQPPLYRVKKGKFDRYAYSDEERDRYLDEVGRAGVHLQRYKGLGEMNPDQLWETTMNPETRTLLKISSEDAAEAERSLLGLDGRPGGASRKFIEENALFVRNLDI